MPGESNPPLDDTLAPISSPIICDDSGPGDPLDAAAPPSLDGRLPALPGYAVEGLLGRGGMGAVYLATDAKLGRRVAVKVMLPSAAEDARARERFLREARAAARVDHDNVVPIHHIGEDATGKPFLVMPLLRGESLESLLRREPRPPLALTLQAGREIAEGLAAAHAVGLVHRDVKPSNVWAESGPDGQLRRFRLLDFGLARAADAEPGLSSAGGFIGTPFYMAPEQAGGEADERSDLFSLGVVLYEMAGGARPFAGRTVMEVLSSLALHDPPPLRELNPAAPGSLSDLTRRLMAKKKEGRPASAAEVAAELAAIAAEPPEAELVPLEPSRSHAPAAPARRGAARWVAATFGGAALAAGAVFLLPGGVGPAPEPTRRGAPERVAVAAPTTAPRKVPPPLEKPPPKSPLIDPAPPAAPAPQPGWVASPAARQPRGASSMAVPPNRGASMTANPGAPR